MFSGNRIKFLDYGSRTRVFVFQVVLIFTNSQVNGLAQ
jgi:hypothetical protein